MNEPMPPVSPGDEGEFDDVVAGMGENVRDWGKHAHRRKGV